MTRKLIGDDYEGSQFGIPSPPETLLGEEPAIRAERIAAVHQLVVDVFVIAEKHLGAEEARSLWASVVPPMTRGAKQGTRDRERDDFLLNLYDFAISELGLPPKAVPGQLGRRLTDKSLAPHLKWKATTAEAAEKMIRRLVKRRAKARAALDKLQPTILSSAGLKSSDK